MAVAAPIESLPSRMLSELTDALGVENVLSRHDERLVYECDGYVINKQVPDVVVFPTSTAQVVEVVKICNRHGVPFVPEGGDEPGGGDVGRRRRGDDLPDADEAHSRGQHPRPLCDRRAGRRERLADALRLGGIGLPLRA